MNLTDSQRRLLKSADCDGRVFARLSRELEELIQGGYLEENVYNGNCYRVRKTADGKNVPP